ncbi:hypothetical protein NZD88_02000 [Chryseobacterium antibioticum]|uniref:Uncharacterized protein n=1 Tax=Chryseobacterium pyrolae TaxID=2987481 RepID=A0ABT2ICG8_9FLAO|nr:hypothetical protein [Chryseobacterium pyrolae]MCT2406326.1 hypothetical protein [Chryseobacterium pyrolae]
MKNIFLSFIVLFVSLFSVKAFSQFRSEELEAFQLTKEEYKQLKNYLLSKNLKVTDTIFIKYDFNKENCWNGLDNKSKDYINKVVQNFQNYTSRFNQKFETAVAYNFRQPGKSMNKLKLWDNTIIIDDQEILKKLIFKTKVQCGCSALILSDGSYLMFKRDPHFALLNLHHNYEFGQF